MLRSLLLALALTLTPVAAYAQQPVTRAATRPVRAVIVLEDGAQPRALGVVLAGTGRILTALDPLHESRDLHAVYPDDRRVRVRPVAVDLAWGVVLLESEAGAWPEGLDLATRDARTRDVVGWFPAMGAEPSSGVLARRRSFVGSGATLLRDAWEIDPVPAATAVGGPLLHPQGTVLGVIVPPGRQEITGAETAFGVPLHVIRALVERAGESTRPWVGITFAEILGGEGDVSSPTGGLRVRAVAPDGPGARAGLRGGNSGDVVVAVDGRPVPTMAAFGEIIAPLRAGDTITLQVLRRGAVTDVPVVLAAHPREPTPSMNPPPAAPAAPPTPAAPAPPRPARRPTRPR